MVFSMTLCVAAVVLFVNHAVFLNLIGPSRPIHFTALQASGGNVDGALDRLMQ